MNNLMTQSWASAHAAAEAAGPAADVEAGPTGANASRPMPFWLWQGKDVKVECDNRGDSGSGSGVSLQVFHLHVESINSDIAAVSAAVRAAEATQKGVATAPSLAAVTALRQQLNAYVASIRQQAVKVRSRVAKLQAENETRRRSGQWVGGSEEERHRSAVTHSLGRKLHEVMADFAALGAAMDAANRAEVERQVQIVTGEKPSAAELDRMMEAGGSEDVLRAAVAGQGRGGAAGLLAELSARQDAMREVSREMEELQGIFVDMAALVEEQGETLDEVEVKVGEATSNVKGGVEQLVKARWWQRKTRQWQVAIAVIILLVVVLIVGITLIQK